MNDKRCEFEDEDGNRCGNRAARKYCGTHRSAAAALRQARYRQRNSAKMTPSMSEVPDYIPVNNTRGMVNVLSKDNASGELPTGRTIPRPHDVPPRAARSHEEPEVVDYSKGGHSRPGLYERPATRSSAPPAARRDAVAYAKWQASERMRDEQGTRDGNGIDWARLSELGEDGYLSEQASKALAQEGPHRYSAFFQAPWRRGDGGYDPTEADMLDGNAIGWRRR